MNRIARIATALAMAGAAIGLAGPAHADDLSGTYTLLSDQSQRAVNGTLNPYPSSSATWIITSCGAGCARVAATTGWTADARLVHGRWGFSREAVWSCPDGRQLPNTIGYSFDAVTLTGTSTGRIPAGCEGFPVNVDGIRVSLTRR
ncbi:hypothetical protein AB0K11_01525 [Mycobacterium sp. NPDC050551]|uniref:hypothetical protein n=1 Tax=Mycobacterium sp. NPDC050551 TaxID=3155407 RepID=UPI003419CC5C